MYLTWKCFTAEHLFITSTRVSACRASQLDDASYILSYFCLAIFFRSSWGSIDDAASKDNLFTNFTFNFSVSFFYCMLC